MLRILTQRKTGFFAWKCVEFFTQSLGGAEDAEVGWNLRKKRDANYLHGVLSFSRGGVLSFSRRDKEKQRMQRWAGI
jgi:hypothetical protein